MWQGIKSNFKLEFGYNFEQNLSQFMFKNEIIGLEMENFDIHVISSFNMKL